MVNDTGTHLTHHLMSDRISPAPGLGTLPSVVTSSNTSHLVAPSGMLHSPITTALVSGNSNTSMSPSPTTQIKTQVTSMLPEEHTQILTRPRLQDLVREIDPTEQLDEEVEELLLQLADDFVENTVNAACTLAKHRKSKKVDIQDVQLHLERNWKMWVPGFGNDELRPYKRASVTEAHKQRMALIRKAQKKY